MADDAKGKESEAPLERHLFAAGGDASSASAKLMGLLSDEDVAQDRLSSAGPVAKPDEDGTPADDPAPGVVEGEQEEEVVDEDDAPLGSEQEEDLVDDDGYEYEYVDEEGNVIEEELVDTHTVPVDGKDREVTLDELKTSFSFKAHNTQVSQELAERRKALDTEAEGLRQGREVYGQRLQQMEQALAASVPTEPDWDTLETEDPAKFATESARWARHHRKVDALKLESQRVLDEQVAEEQTQLNAFKADQGKRMMEAIPEWGDEKVYKTEQTRMVAYAKESLGFSDEEVSGFLDHRAVVVMRKAMLFDELQAKGTKAVKGGKTAALKPGTRRRRRKAGGAGSKRANASRQRLSQTGSVQDAEAALLDILGDDA